MPRRVAYASLIAVAIVLVACGGGGSNSGGGNVPPPVVIPIAPSGAVAVAGDASVSLTWNSVSGATGYYANRGTTSGGPYARLASTATASFNDTGLTNGTTYYYVITAYNSAGVGAQSSEVSVMPVMTGLATTVDFGAVRQVIRGFGGSSAWITDLNAHPGMADKLFGNSAADQIGLSILRVRIDPSPDPGGHTNWATERSNAGLAIARGARVIATPWSPPASMKSNSDVNNGGKLNAASYASYASYLQSFVTYMQNGGSPLYAISMQNEADWSTSYESCVWTGAEMHTWVANNASVITTKLIMPEAVNLTSGSLMALADPSLNDPVAAAEIDIVGTHLYGTAPAPYANAATKNKEVWMTEHTVDSTGLQGAMDLAREIHDSLTVGNYNAYLYWWLQNWIVGNNSPYTAGLINDPGLDLELTKKGFAMGQFSKFVRPDYVRTDATANPSAGIYISAYKDIANSHFVVVAINTGNADINQPFTIQNQTLTQLIPHRTSANENLAQLGAVNLVGGSFSYRLPGRSVTTFVAP